MSISNYNSKGKQFVVDNSDFPFIKLRDLVPGREYPLFGCFVTKDNGYGEGAVLITADNNVNIPNRYVDKIRSFQNDPDVIDQINEGKAAFKYEVGRSEKYNRDVYLITWIDK